MHMSDYKKVKLNENGGVLDVTSIENSFVMCPISSSQCISQCAHFCRFINNEINYFRCASGGIIGIVEDEIIE